MFAQIYFAYILFQDRVNGWTILLGLGVFFVGFNLLESLQPSLVSRLAGQNRGAGLGVYNTTMSIGLFLGGILGGWIYGHLGMLAIFEVDSLLLFVWLIIALRMPELPSKSKTA